MTIQSSTGVPVWTLGDRLRKARETRGLGVRDFAELIGVSHQTVTNAEKGHTRVRRITLNAWSAATGVPVAWLESGTVAPSPGDGAALAQLTAAKRRRGTVTGRYANAA